MIGGGKAPLAGNARGFLLASVVGYALNKPHAWVLDAQIMLYGVLFMMAGAYTLAKNGHVRGDVLYGFFSPRTQATVDLVLYILFFVVVGGMGAMSGSY